MSYCRGGGGKGRRLPGVDTDGTFAPFESSTSNTYISYANTATNYYTLLDNAKSREDSHLKTQSNVDHLIYLNAVGDRTSVMLGVASAHGPASVANDVIIRMTS